MDKVNWSSTSRFKNWLSIGGVQVPVMTILISAIPIVEKVENLPSEPTVHITHYGATICFIGIALCVGSLLRNAYKRRMYDPILALKFQETFDDMKEQRKKAALAILECRKKNDWSSFDDYSALDDVFNFLDDLGFYLYADRIGERVMYHHFYHWVEMYYQSAMPYIILERKKYNSQWEFIPNLHERLIKIESVKRNKTPSEIMLSEKEITEKLTDESQD